MGFASSLESSSIQQGFVKTNRALKHTDTQTILPSCLRVLPSHPDSSSQLAEDNVSVKDRLSLLLDLELPALLCILHLV